MITTPPREEEYAIAREADVVLLQRRVRSLAATAGFGVRAQWEIAIAASEAAHNILKYAGTGRLVVRVWDGEGALEFEAVDQGPGIGDLHAALRDGVSRGRDLAGDPRVTSRSGLGLGFGTMRRLMDTVEVESSTAGTRVRARRSVRSSPG